MPSREKVVLCHFNYLFSPGYHLAQLTGEVIKWLPQSVLKASAAYAWVLLIFLADALK